MTLRGKFQNLVVAALLLSGCGGGGSDDVTVTVPTVPVESDKGIAAFNFVLARAVPTDVDTIEFFGFDANGALIFGPAPRTKAAQIVLESLPLDIRTFRLDYYDGDLLVGQGEVPIILSPNGRVSVNDPDFVDVTAVSLVVAPEDFELTLGTSRNLNVTATLSNGDTFDVADGAIYTSSNPAVVSVDSEGKVTGVALGQSTITIEYRDVMETAIVNVVAANG